MRRWSATVSSATCAARRPLASARSGSTAASGRRPTIRPYPTRGSRAWARSALGSPRWRLAALLLEARPDLVGQCLEVGRGDQHHVEQVGQLADRALAALAAQRGGRLAGLLDQLRGDRVGSSLEELA